MLSFGEQLSVRRGETGERHFGGVVDARRQPAEPQRGEQGEIAIAFASQDELNGLLDRLGVTER